MSRRRLQSCILLVAGAFVGLAAAPADASQTARQVIGHSVRGRPIAAYHLGVTNGAPVLVVGCVDGDEPAGIAIAATLRRLAPANRDLWLIPTVNPDGSAAGTRGNANGVDLNRNFPHAWQSSGGNSYSGPRPLSEPESRALYRFILRVKPKLSIWFHQPLALVDDSQGSQALEQRWAKLVGLPLEPLTDYPGSITNWENHRFPGSTAFVTELPPGPLTHARAERFARAVLTLAQRLSG